MPQLQITDDLDALLDILPENISQAILEVKDSSNFLEVVLDLGRVPTARFLHGEVTCGKRRLLRKTSNMYARGWVSSMMTTVLA